MSTRYPSVVFKINFEDDPLAAYSEYIQALGPMGYWRLNESAGTTATDSSVNARNGTYTGGFTLSQTGALVPYGDSDNAVLFNGSTGFVDFTSSSTWQNLYSAWTLAAWIYPTATREATSTDNAGIITCQYTGSGRIPFYLSYGRNAGATGSQVWGGYWDGSGWENVIDPIEATLNTYQHFICTFDGSLLSLWRDFELVNTTVVSDANGAGGGNRKLYIGNTDLTVTGTDEFFPGRIDEPFILDWAMGPSHVAKLQGSLTAVLESPRTTSISPTACARSLFAPVARMP